MISVPAQNITNATAVGSSINHPILGPAQLITTPNDQWQLQNTLPVLPLEYPPLSPSGNATLLVVWNSEITNIIKSEPSHTAQWMAWMGSLAMMVLMGKMLRADIGTAQTLLKDRLNRIRLSRGVISPTNQFVYDRTWGGIIGKMGLNNCSGDFDSGTAFYNSPTGQFGYLVYAYAVMSSLDATFRDENRAVALCFARHVANPCEGDRYFPLWRSKDWYLGYSISSGLQPNQARGKETSNPGDAVLGYYGCYLLATVLNESELAQWSASMLASEITAVQHYFQFASTSSITVDPAFVQGTITERGDTYYNYTVPGGNPTFPARNASIMVPVVKPLSLASPTYLNETWALQTQTWMAAAAAAPGIQPESLLYALSLMAVAGNNLPEISETIVNNRTVLLPYGSTWSSALYWVGSQ
jgi:endoglucanase Acf2